MTESVKCAADQGSQTFYETHIAYWLAMISSTVQA